MTNWPNIQEYRNLEAKFIDDSKRNIDSAADSDLGTVKKDEYNVKHTANDFVSNEKIQNSESKTVRCVIRKDFEDGFKKLDRENGMVNQELMRPKPQETAAVARSCVDHVRLQNHLKWKKQKKEEYFQKKEAEKLAQQKKREEEVRLEKTKKQKEKEKEGKIREWQEQKVREKEEKKKEKMVMKMLQKELQVTPPVDKEKLIEEWVKLKNKQKQMEAEKKAELLKKEEENRALRQNLAELSYRQWKERIKGKMITLPKNGYQIFGPKPVPVVKEDWNHDFISGSPRHHNNSLRGTKSNTTTSLTLRPAIKELEDLSKDIFYLGDIKSKNQSFYNLKRSKSGYNLYENFEMSFKKQCDMPLRELQTGTVDLKKKETKAMKSGFGERIQQELTKKSGTNFFAKFRGPEILSNDFMCLQAQGDQNPYVEDKKLELLDSFIGSQLLPNKKKIDLYINTDPVEDSSKELQKKKNFKTNKTRAQREVRSEVVEKGTLNVSSETCCKQRCCALLNRTRSLSLQKNEIRAEKIKVKAQKITEPKTAKTCRRSQSYDKSIKGISKKEHKLKSLSSKLVKVTAPVNEVSKNLRLAKSRTCCSQKRRSRKPGTPEAPTKSEKKLSELDYKTKKKIKKKCSLSKSFSFSDSPYCTKNATKSLNKGKPVRRKSMKDMETKSEESGRCQMSTTKI